MTTTSGHRAIPAKTAKTIKTATVKAAHGGKNESESESESEIVSE